MERSGPIDPKLRFAIDYELSVRMMKIGRFKHIHDFLAAFRVHPSAKSSTLYETIGREEVALVQRRHGITVSWRHVPLKFLFGGSILAISWLYKKLRLPLIRHRFLSFS